MLQRETLGRLAWVGWEVVRGLGGWAKVEGGALMARWALAQVEAVTEGKVTAVEMPLG